MDSLTKQKSIVLPYDQNSVTIAFSTLTYQTTYAIFYKLEELDKEWISAKNSEAIYNYLPPGTYTFKIQAVNADNVFSKEMTTLSITVQAPFWKTWWFYSLLLLAGIIFLYLLDRERMKRKAVLQTMRSNISGNLHEEINNALQNINVLSEIARIKADKEPEQTKSYIDEINHKSNSLIEAMDDMLWSIDPVNDTMTHTLNRMKEIAHTISHQYNTYIQVHNDDKVILLKPDMRRRHELMMIYKIALQLLAEQMHARNIQVELSFIKSHVQLNIFAANVKLANNSQVQDTIKHLKAKASTLMSSLEVQPDEKGVGFIISVKR
jgi:signal transduction histidine kinase